MLGFSNSLQDWEVLPSQFEAIRSKRFLERGDDWSSSPVEVIVDASANRVPTRVVVHIVQACSNVPAVGVAVAAADVGVEILYFRRPVWHEHPLYAAASCPAGLRGADRLAIARRAGRVAVSEAARAVDEEGRHN